MRYNERKMMIGPVNLGLPGGFAPWTPTWNPFENILAPLGSKFACGEVCEGSKTSQNFQKSIDK